jgi:hypothetical protein
VGRPRRQRRRPQPGEGRLPGSGEPGRYAGGDEGWWEDWSASFLHATAHFPADEDHTNIEENNRSAAIAWVRDHM